MTELTAPGRVLHAAFRSDPGRVRTNNEDLPLVDAERGVYGVIDGVGGQVAGEVAAAIASDVIQQRLARPLGTPAERAREAIALANNEIFRRAETTGALSGMTCVVTLAIVADARLTIGHVGDSRLYKLRAGTIRKLTHDHSPVGEREDAREISELEAMRHPRRNEVFRDVGGALRDKDEADYVEIVEEPLEPDAAILLCTDGLTDMIPTSVIDRLVHQHAGNPEEVVDALIAAANDAGGRDNVTVVYAEGPDFASSLSGRSAVAPAGVQAQPAPPSQSRPVADRTAARVGRWILHSRMTWFAIGALLGVIGALWLALRASDATARVEASRTIVAVPGPAAATDSLGAAVAGARPGDVISLEPGLYPERVTLADGVSLIARVPGSVTFVRAPGVAHDWVVITAGGDLGGRISGIRIESTPELPVAVGMRVAGQSRTIDLAEMAGPMRAGIELLPGSAATLHGNQLAVLGTGLAVGERSQAVATANVFLRTRRGAGPAVLIGEAGQATLRRNVFVGYGTDIVQGGTPADRQQHLALNVIVSAEPALGR